MTGTKGGCTGSGASREVWGSLRPEDVCVCGAGEQGWSLTSSPLTEGRRKLSSCRSTWAELASTLRT